MKKYFPVFALLVCCYAAHSQSGTWVWMKGDSTLNSPSTYGTMGVPDPANNPTALYEAANWIDLDGNFWIFGGVDSNGTDGQTNDLWRYSPASNIWTWMQGPSLDNQLGVYGTLGVPSPTNLPGARGWGCLTWTSANGDLWLYGGQGFDGFGNYGTLNDLWKYTPATNEWTWINGANNIYYYYFNRNRPVFDSFQVTSLNNNPGGRTECNSTWTDNSNGLWFFGGQTVDNLDDVTMYNDTWRYDLLNNEWAWMKGPPVKNNPGHYGTFRVENDSNLPPARQSYTHWKDAEGNFYVWGGINNVGPDGVIYSDVWKYNTHTNNWTWVAGEDTPNSMGYYQQYCLDNENTGPRARYENRTAQTLNCSNVFLAYAGATLYGEINCDDLWLFNSQTYEWWWVGGVQRMNEYGNSGAKTIPSSANLPMARLGQAMWQDSSGVLWMFGGMSIGFFPDGNRHNDVWKYIPAESCAGPFITGIDYSITDNEICNGDSARLTLLNVAGARIWPDTLVQWVDSAHITLFPDTTTAYYVTGATPCHPADTAFIKIYVSNLPPIDVTATKDSICAGDTAQLCAPAGYASYLWNTGQTTSCITATATGTYSVAVGDTGNCKAFSSPVIINSFSPAPITIASRDTQICSGDSAIICAPAGYLNYSWNTGQTGNCIITNQAGNYYLTVIENGGCTTTSNRVDISVFPVSPVSITVSGDTLKGYDAATYQWLLNNDTLAGATLPVYIAAQPGTYTLQVTDSNGCTAVSLPLVISKIQQILQNEIHLFPNPTNSNWQLWVSDNWLGSNLKLFDDQGRMIFNTTIEMPNTNLELTSSGLYFLMLSSATASATIKLVRL